MARLVDIGHVGGTLILAHTPPSSATTPVG